MSRKFGIGSALTKGRARGRLRLAAAIAFALFQTCTGPSGARAQTGSVYVVAKLAIEAEAKDAVAAKKKAFAEAQRRALGILMRRITPFGAFDRLPEPKLSLIEELIEGFSVQRESNSATRYLATLDFTFQAEAVRQFLSGYRIAYTEGQAPVTSVLPVFVRNGAIRRSTVNAWRKAWRRLDLRNSVTPVKLAAVGGAVTAKIVDGLRAGKDDAFEALTAAYRSERLVVALGTFHDGEDKFTTRLYGVDAAGALHLQRTDRIWDGDLRASANHAAMVSLRIFEGRWKTLKSTLGAAASGAEQFTFAVTVEFAGLRQWQKMRTRLARAPGVQALKIGALSARSAEVTLQFPGGPEKLAQQLEAYNLELQNAGGVWILRTN